MEEYIKKPITVKAIEFREKDAIKNPSKYPMVTNMNLLTPLKTGFYIETLEGNMTVSDGDYIIKGIRGEYYPCKPDIFEETYGKHEKLYPLEEVGLAVYEQGDKLHELANKSAKYSPQAAQDLHRLANRLTDVLMELNSYDADLNEISDGEWLSRAVGEYQYDR